MSDTPIEHRIARIRELAKQVGYAIGVHGSLERDVDLIAVPWTDKAIGNAELIALLEKELPAIRTEHAHRPHGRVGVILQGFGRKWIDLSIMPRIVKRAITDDSLSPYDLSDKRHPANRRKKP